MWIQPCQHDLGRIMQFFPSSQHGEAAATPPLVCAGWVGGQLQNRLLYLSSAKEASLSITTDVFTKSGPKGDPVSACGLCSLPAARRCRAANNRHNNTWQSAEAAFKGKINWRDSGLRTKKLQARASSEETNKSDAHSKNVLTMFAMPCVPA